MNAIELLGKLVAEYEQWEKDREASFRNLETYDPVPGDQPCKDWEMGDYDELDETHAFHAQNTFVAFAAEARKILEEVKK
jgi:hypothetical protein